MKFSYLLIISLLSIAVVNAKPIKGRVTDAITGDALVGASVVDHQNSSSAVYSGLDGTFSIDIKSTTAKLLITYVGYINKEISAGEQDGFLKIALQPSPKNIGAVTIVGKSDERKARNLEKLSPNVINVVSARAIEISPDLTVANVIQRVSGVTIERNNTGDGQYALLRGMDKRYNYTLVNGVKIPSPDNKNRFVPLDIFPAEMLERLEVTKSLTPDMEGDGIGGAINMVMKDAPQKFQVSGNVAAGFNTLFFDRPFYTYNKSLILSQSPYEELGSNYPAKPKDFNAGLLDIKEASFRPNLYGGLSLGQRFFKNKLGVLIAGTYQDSRRGSNSTNFSYTTATSDASNLPVLTSVNYRTYSEEQIRAGVHAKLDYKISPNHSIQWYNAYLDFKAYQVRDEQITDFSIGYDPDHGNYNLAFDTRFRYTHQRIINSTLKGEHHFFNQHLSVDWSAVYSKANNELPDNSTVHTVANVRNGVQGLRSVVTLGGAERRWEHNTDEDKAAYLNMHYKTGSAKLPIVLSVGGLYRDKQRTNFFNEYSFRPFDESKPVGSQNNLIETIDWHKYSEIKFMVFTPYGATGNPLNYDAYEKIAAGYAMGRINAAKWEALAGVRVENTNQGYDLKYPVQGVQNTGEQKYTDVLPSVNFKYLLTAKQNLRLSYYKAINRPSFFEIVPYRIVNEDFTEAGNPDLKHTVAHNVDLRYESFPTSTDQLMVGLFYKRILDPIEFGTVVQGQGSFYMPNNFGDANNYGLEFDYTKFFRHFGVKFNYTFTNSKITTSKLYYYNNPDTTASDKVLLKPVDQTRSLTGQAAHVANATLFYKHTKAGIDAQLSATYTGNRLYAVSRYFDNDIWQGDFVQFDASAEKKIFKHFVVFAKATNIFNSAAKQYVKKTNAVNENMQGYQEYKNGTMIREDKYGTTILAGIKFKY